LAVETSGAGAGTGVCGAGTCPEQASTVNPNREATRGKVDTDEESSTTGRERSRVLALW